MPQTRIRLKALLRALDLFALVLGWVIAYRLMFAIGAATPEQRLPLIGLGVVGVVAALLTMASKRLWLSRVCAVRSAELEGLGGTAVLSSLVVLAVDQLIDYDAPDRFALAGAAASFVLLVVLRSSFRHWLNRARKRGLFARRLVLVGANAQSENLYRLMLQHPESGFEIVGLCGAEPDGAQHDGLPWLGEHADAAAAVKRTGSTGALVVASALDPHTLNRTLRDLLKTGCHVHLSSGLTGISHERLLPLPVAREPLFYLERTSLTRSQMRIKRVMDVAIGGVLALVLLPVVAIAALAIKLEDGGPVFFRQRRVGRSGTQFTLFKLRTMVVNAERMRGAVANSRNGGPLFKARRDPRITRVGRFLRATSIDEVPQLLNVLRGEMSMVGPRPALPSEVAEFDEELRQRGRMLPGLTGLWQVEARDDPSFDTYRRLDLFYVENWSIGLDLAIIFGTAGVVLPRGLRVLRSREAAGV